MVRAGRASCRKYGQCLVRLALARYTITARILAYSGTREGERPRVLHVYGVFWDFVSFSRLITSKREVFARMLMHLDYFDEKR